jgi:type VII secretion-associated serine protease mycosin
MILTAAVLPTALVAVCFAGPASATPGPHDEEWWFSGWSLQQDVWPLTKGRGVTVAVIDSGVNASLPDLQGAVVPGKTYDRPSERGMVDHDLGHGFEGADAHGHGTGMASLIAAQGRDTGWVGVAPEAKILPIATAEGTPRGAEELADSIRYATDHGAKVISMSIAYDLEANENDWPEKPPCPQVVEEAVIYALEHDVVLIAGSGNAGNRNDLATYPAGCPGVIAVGAIKAQGLDPAEWTQRKDYVMVAAPGEGVGSIGKDGHLYHWGRGTSQATALTSGIVALIRSRFPDMPARQVVQRLINTAKDVGPKGKDDQTGYGLIIAGKALTADVPASAPNPVYEALDKWKAERARQQRELYAKPPGAPSGGGSSGGIVSSLVDAVEGMGLRGTSGLLILGSGIVLVIGAVAVALVISRRRRSDGQPWG